MTTHITSVEQLKLAMFEYQVKKAWTSIETILRRAAGKPEPRRGNLKKASVPLSTRIVLRALLRCFSVDDKLSFRCKGVFDARGFRKCGYRQFGRWLSDRTIGWAIQMLRDLGIITAYQERNPDGSWGQWWIRLNPDVLLHWATTEPVLSSAPSAIDCRLSSSPQGAEAVASSPIADAPEKKKNLTPSGGEVLLSEEQAEAETRRIMMETPVGEVVRRLEGVVPGIEKLTVPELKKLQRWMEHPSSNLRLSGQTLEDLVMLLKECSGQLEEFSHVDGTGLVLCWRRIAKVLLRYRTSRHEARMLSVEVAVKTIKDAVFSPAPLLNRPEHFNNACNDSQLLVVRHLVMAMTRKWSTRLTAALANQVSGFLRIRPLVYKQVWDRLPQIRALCQIPFELHASLIKEAKQLESTCQLWNCVKEQYGFEPVYFGGAQGA